MLSRHVLTVSDFQILIKSCSIESRKDPSPKSEVVNETKFSLKIFYSTHVCLAQLDQHQTCKPVMVSVVISSPTGGNFIFFKTTQWKFCTKMTEMSARCYLRKPRLLCMRPLTLSEVTAIKVKAVCLQGYYQLYNPMLLKSRYLFITRQLANDHWDQCDLHSTVYEKSLCIKGTYRVLFQCATEMWNLWRITSFQKLLVFDLILFF